MKYLITILVLFFHIGTINAQTQDPIPDSRDFSEEIGRYELYPTTNTWTLLKLDTKYGYVRQVQYSMEDESRFELVIFSPALCDDKEAVIGRFKLVPTKNMYTFLILDTSNG